MAAKRGGKGYKETYNNVTATATAITTHAAILLAVILLFIPSSTTAFINFNTGPKVQIIIQNNYTNYLSVRCFTFEKSERVQHLESMKQFTFTIPTNGVFPSATMVNCSTNMGVFVAYRYDYSCKIKRKCEWRFDLNQSYVMDPISGSWQAMEYNPNYESLERGGVVQSRYTNKK